MWKQHSGLIIFCAFAIGMIALAAYARWWQLHGGGKALREKEERRKRERASAISMRGWNYDPTIEGNIHYRITGESEGGLAWRVEYDSDQSSSSSTPKLVFRVPSLGDGVYHWTIHDRPTWELTQKSGVRAVVGGISKLVGTFSEGMRIKRDFYLNAAVLKGTGAAFSERYVLAATDPKWRALLSEELERRILTWPSFKATMSRGDNSFSVELGPDGLKAQLFADAPDVAVIEHLIRVGERLADSTTRIRAGGMLA